LSLRDQFEDAGFTPKHIQNLQEIGTLLEKSAETHPIGWATKVFGSAAGVEGMVHASEVLHAVANPAGAVGLAGTLTARQLVGKIMTDPKFASTVANGLRKAGSIAGVAAGSGAAAVQAANNPLGKVPPGKIPAWDNASGQLIGHADDTAGTNFVRH
jgi:hypothetical protein